MEELGMPNMSDDLVDMGNMFTEEEVWGVLRDLPIDRAMGQGRFIACWPVIKPELVAAICRLHVGDGRGFGRLNRALILLIPKKPDANEMGNYSQLASYIVSQSSGPS
jgi:hypothetical protein